MENKTRNILLVVVLSVLAGAVILIVVLKSRNNRVQDVAQDTVLTDTLSHNSSPADTVTSQSVGDTIEPAADPEPDVKSENPEPEPQEPEPVGSDPVSKALSTGRPVLVDFGRGTCIPCKKMMPILAELKEEYSGKVEVLVLDLDEYFELAKEYGVQMIPTQIFFDPSGNEIARHVGFMEKQAMVDQLANMGTD